MSDRPTASGKLSIDTLALQMAENAAGEKGPNAVMYAFFQLFKTAQIHAIDNQALIRPIQTMVEITTSIVTSEGRISFQAKDKAIFVNGTKLKLTHEEYELAQGIFEFFEERGMGGFAVEAPMTTEDVRTLLRAMVYAAPADRKFDRLDPAIRASRIPFRINRPIAGGGRTDEEAILERRSQTIFTYAKLVVLYQNLMADEKPNPVRRQFLTKKAGRVVQTLCDLCIEDGHTFASAAMVRNADAYGAHHAANVAVLSILIGSGLGLSRSSLADLGLAAVFIDTGLQKTPEIVDKPEPLTAEERTAIGVHPMRSVEFLLEEKKLSKAALARIIAAFEHHRHCGGGGYPPAGRRPHLFSRIIAVADVFDALTNQRPWRDAYLPDEALALMVRESGKYFDPLLLKLFVTAIGFYPVGSVVRLDDGATGVVVYSGGDARVTRPVVSINGTPVDLAKSTRKVAAAQDPAKLGINPMNVLAGSAVVVS